MTATHRCKICGSLWRLDPPGAVLPGGSWSVATPERMRACCDNAVMGDQIEPIRRPIIALHGAAKAAKQKELGVDADNNPLGLSDAEKAAAQPVTPEQMHMSQTPAEISPTGKPVVGTGLVLKIAAVIVALAAIAYEANFFPDTTVDEKVATAIISIGAILGIASPGIRRK